MALRQGIRAEEQNQIVRRLQHLRNEGIAPDEAFSQAVQVAPGIHPDVLANWRPELEKRALEPAPLPLRQENIFTRVDSLNGEIERLQKTNAKLSAENEELQRKLDSFNKENADLREVNAKLSAENEELILGDDNESGKKIKK